MSDLGVTESMNATMRESITLGEIAELVSGELRGDATIRIRGVAPVNSAQPGDLTWVTDEGFAKQLGSSQASAALIAPEFVENGQTRAVVCEKPELALALVMKQLQPPLPHPPIGIDPTAVVGKQVELSEGVAIGPKAVVQNGVKIGRGSILHAGTFVGEGTVLGEDCVFWPNVVIREHCFIGNRVTIHPNATIGADGFGYNFDEGKYRKIPHIGRVRIEDDVEIGAGSCIDRAKCGETVVGKGSKIDNLVQIAHNVIIGEHCCIIAQVGIAGSTTLGHHVLLAGKVGLKDNIAIGSKVQVAACSCVAGDVQAGAVMMGTPAIPKSEFFKERLTTRRIPKLTEELRELRKRVERIEAANHSKDS